MKDIGNKIIIVLGILFIGSGIFSIYNNEVAGSLTSNYVIERNLFDFFFIILGFLLIYYSRSSLKLHKDEEEKFNFRYTDSVDNCLKCKCCDPKSLSNCKFFHIEIDENHVCDLLEPQLDEENIKGSN